jgi:hypothetical protein
MDDFFEKGEHKLLLSLIISIVLLLVVFEIFRLFSRKYGLFKTHRVKIHEGNFPKPPSMKEIVP